MSIFTNILSKVLTKTAEAVFLTAGTIIGITAAVAVRAIELMADEYNKYRAQNAKIDAKQNGQYLAKEVKEVNDKILELESKQKRDGYLKDYERAELHELYVSRNGVRDQLLANKELIVVEQINKNPQSYDTININSRNSHVLQFHVGQTVFGKYCSLCRKPMILQFKRGQYSINMSDFFWSCSGWYEDHSHNVTFPFVLSDMELFTKTDRPEFELSSEKLGDIVKLPGPSSTINKRLHDAKNTATDVYFCPIHNEPMILREKKNPDGLLDQYFFSCPRFECHQLVKIKSPAQLSSALEAFYGRGIF